MARLSAAHEDLIAALVPAGWERTRLSLMMGAADLTFQNPTGELYVHRPSVAELTLVEARWRVGGRVRFTVDDKGEIGTIVELLRDWQNRLTVENFARFQAAVTDAYSRR
ncbi:MAG: hypothetical protein JXA67_19460 [Micromonosporaceae bacterium]|nr:hypothetical protein [Micromonosporaceae bacterium]